MTTPAFIDDELIITVRIRLAGPDVRDRIAGPALISLPGHLHTAIKDILDPGDVDLAGIEITLPTFTPIGTTGVGGGLTHEFTSPSDGLHDLIGQRYEQFQHAEGMQDLIDLVQQGLTTDGAHHKQWYLEQVAQRLGLDVTGYVSGVAP